MKELKSLQDSVKQIEGMFADHEDLGLLIEMSEEEPDEDTIAEIQEELERFKAEFEELRIQTLLTGEYDKSNAIVTLHAGAGGTESCDWTGMLYRMYSWWAEKKGFSLEVLDYLEGDVAGIKGVTLRCPARMPTASCARRREYTAWCGFPRSMRRASGRRPFLPAT